ncbi:MAG: exodeoxyribonuclease V subunit gamma, partial [Gammaproteobacteria bacterium]|nr:exodeoxyribonuclease V subunit gamma [Gammaproteobacteria bacterium]
MLTTYSSNSQEELIAQLAQITSTQRPHPLTPEIIVTQTPGMARWISVQLAKELGVAANLEFPLPATFFWKLFTSQFPELGKTSGYEKPVMTWRVMKLLPQLLEQPAFAPLANYLKEHNDSRRLHQLSRRVADVLDQYLIYRHEMVLEWEQQANNDANDWQSILWQHIVADTGHRPNRAQLLRGFLQKCSNGELKAENLPHRFSFFGIATLPPAYVQLLQCLAEQTEVNLFILNPCQYFWGDISDEKRIAHKRRKLILNQQGEEDYYEIGNRLLASMGKQGQEFINMLLDLDGMEQDYYIAPETNSILTQLQYDILEMDETVQKLDEVDNSISIHSCQSPMREVQVLQDQLLDLFNTDDDLGPEDVIIMTPDVETYAPYIEAVFGAADGKRVIPWTISDRTPHGQHPVVRAFQSLLDVCTGRFAVNDVLSLLEVPAVHQRFDLHTDDIQRLRTWLKESGIRWGLNSNSRKELEISYDSHTWQFGLRRLLLGYAMPTDVSLYNGIAPYADIEGQSA